MGKNSVHSVRWTIGANGTRRTYKDSLFRFIYSGKDERSKRWLLSLYNALTGKNHTDTSELTITTIEDVIYITMERASRRIS